MWHERIHALRRLTLFRGLLRKPPLTHLLSLDQGVRVSTGDEVAETAAPWLHALVSDPLLWRSYELMRAGDPWEAWLLHGLLTDENPWTLRLERGEDPGPLLTSLAESDLRLLHEARPALRMLLAEAGRWPLPPVATAGEELNLCDECGLPDGYGLPNARDRRQLVDTALDPHTVWPAITDQFARFFRRAGAGVFNLAYAFRFDGELEPVFSPDPTRLEELTGYEKERRRVIDNTQRLMERLPAHNLLLYGDRGTGKSATVKALVHRFGDDGLRLVEVPKHRLASIPALIRKLGERGAPIVLFIDDLSFEADETEYKELKAVLEGSLEPMPGNVRVYATSNRRHLITEKFGDRRSGAFGVAGDEVHSQDGMQEKLSLADRFGQTIVFPTPSQQAYLEIVFALAKRHRISLTEEELTPLALRWATWQNGRSARTAVQFIESLIGAE